jgi:hypothetical protein
MPQASTAVAIGIPYTEAVIERTLKGLESFAMRHKLLRRRMAAPFLGMTLALCGISNAQ